MANLSIEQAHSLPLDEVRKRLTELSERLSAKYGIDAHWISEREASLKRIGVSGKIQVGENTVAVLLDLSFALIPMKSRIQERIQRELKSALA